MNAKQPVTPPSTAASSSGSASATATITNPNDPAALLLNILRSVDREVRSNLELDKSGLEIVERFRAIDRALAVRPVAQRQTALTADVSRATPVAAASSATATR